MRILILLFAFASLFLFSCQKEADFANSGNNNGNGNNGNGGNNGNNGTVLTKVISKSGSDSSSLVFGFNSSQQLMTLDLADVSGGTSSLTHERVERNSQGIIQKLIIKDDAYTQQGIDSVETLMGYASGKYTFKLTVIDFGVFLYKDSVALNYDGNGKVVSEETFVDAGTGSYDTISKAEYTYNGNNVASITYSTYDAGSSSYTLGETFTYDEYDNKINPMVIGYEAFVFDSPEMFSPNNPTKSTVTALGLTQSFTVTYTYNSSGRPLTATSVVQPGGQTITGTYYYQ